MKSYKSAWIALTVTLIVTFTILGYFGKEVYQQAPPVPDSFVTQNGETIYTKDDIYAGQSAWQSIGGMEVGTVWGHGAYQAPDWTADWLHRELTTYLDLKSQETYHKAFADLTPEEKNALQFKASQEYRKNTLNPETNVVTISPERLTAIRDTANYYERLFGDDPDLELTRDHFAMKNNTIPTAEKRDKFASFIFWSAWAAGTNRPDSNVTYTNNWPHEPLINNVPTTENVLWSICSVVLLILGVGVIIWVWAFFGKHDEEVLEAPERDPLSLVTLTPSQKALWKYLVVVVAVFCLQVFLGGLTVHYTVEGQAFYGIPLADWIPYSLSRTWHIQAAIFWIATAFLAAGLFLVPIINGGKDPKFQRLGVNILFIALLIVVGGSFTGEFLAIKGWMPDNLNFWLGHQGYEFVELGRLWQIALYIGLILWLVLMLRGVWAALHGPGDKNLLFLLTLSIAAIGLFYGSGLFYGEHSSLSVMEYWRWWIVHLWVEGFFEVFATVAMAFIFVSLGLIQQRTATVASILSAMLFLLGGVPGTFHHLYFSGTTTPIMAVGAMFSALEVIPLVILGYEAYENWTLQKRAPWMKKMRWPIYFFIAVAFWNMLGAGVFGFLINPPISLFYIQGLNTTANHGHAALFGVYGFLSLGFTMMVLRYIRPKMEFNETLMRVSFWGLNIGLALMLFVTLLPIGLIQAYAAINEGLWYARSEEFMQQGVFIALRWSRILGDTIFIVSAVAIAVQVVMGLLGKYDVNDESELAAAKSEDDEAEVEAAAE